MDEDSTPRCKMPLTGAVRPKNSMSDDEQMMNTPKTAQLPENKQETAPWKGK